MFPTSHKFNLMRLHGRLRVASSVLIVLFACAVNVLAQPAEPADEEKKNHVGTITELRDKRRAWLVVFKSRVLDVNNRDRAIIDDVLKADSQPKGRYLWVYNDLAGKLNKYIRQHGSVRAATGLADAEYVIFFNVVEFRRILNAVYPYGELFVIVKGSPQDSKPPRIVWRARKMLVAEDAIRDLIKDLKALRGEG
jgi:hypothetical protein